MKKIEKRRNEIIEKTVMIIHEKGFNGTGVKEITELAGIPKGSFYNYFESKEDYFTKVVTYQLYRILDVSKNTLQNTELDPASRILMFYKINIDNFERIGFRLGCLIGNLTEEMGDISIKLASTTEEAHQQISKILLANLDDIAKPCVFEHIKNNVLADFIVNSWQGALLRMKSAKSKKPLANFYQMIETMLNTKV